MSFGLQGGATIEKLAADRRAGHQPTWKGMPVLVVVLLGGFAVNGAMVPLPERQESHRRRLREGRGPAAGANLFFAGLAGAIWCSQFICLKTGEPAMGQLAYIGWSVLMASAILFSTIFGIALGEWRNTSGRTRLPLGRRVAVVCGVFGDLGLQRLLEAMIACRRGNP